MVWKSSAPKPRNGIKICTSPVDKALLMEQKEPILTMINHLTHCNYIRFDSHTKIDLPQLAQIILSTRNKEITHPRESPSDCQLCHFPPPRFPNSHHKHVSKASLGGQLGKSNFGFNIQLKKWEGGYCWQHFYIEIHVNSTVKEAEVSEDRVVVSC